MNIKELVKLAKGYYPHSKNLRKQWVRKTVMLANEGKHVLFGGKISWRSY